MSSKIKINPITKEIEIEVSDDFLVKYFDSLGLSPRKSKKLKLSKPVKKTRPHPRKKSVPGENYNTIIEVLKLNKDPMTIKEICETTNLTKTSVGYEIRKGEKKGVVIQTEKGFYEFVKDNNSV